MATDPAAPSRGEHMAWCKRRALEYLDKGDVRNAITSMISDLSKHPETRRDGQIMAQIGLHSVMVGDSDEARRFIEGFR